MGGGVSLAVVATMVSLYFVMGHYDDPLLIALWWQSSTEDGCVLLWFRFHIILLCLVLVASSYSMRPDG
jgi:hypothetical protein